MSNSSSVRRRPARRSASARFWNVFAFLLVALAMGAGPASAADPLPLDLNRATAEQLEALPGIGAVKAAAILAVREERGGFRSLDELESVRGIGPKLAETLRPRLVVGQAKGGAPGAARSETGSGPAAKSARAGQASAATAR